MIDEKMKVISHEDMGNGYRFIRFESKVVAAQAMPGQFVHIKVPGLEDSALRRPFSIFNAEEGVLEVLYKTVGRGTKVLNNVKPGDEVFVAGPLGRGFTTKCSSTALLVGGGYGVAPLYFLARKLQCEKILFTGGRTAADILGVEQFKAIGVEPVVSTNDGSLGVKGLVTLPLDEKINELRKEGKPFELFACGPDGMLKAVSDRAITLGVPGWISMDRHMVCGVGACYACIQKTVRGNSRCCIEGPVFKAEELVWE
jgi:dihydroorotate dehydrogenase electron transfer subunit